MAHGIIPCPNEPGSWWFTFWHYTPVDKRCETIYIDFLPPTLGEGNPRVSYSSNRDDTVLEGFRDLWWASVAVFGQMIDRGTSGAPSNDQYYQEWAFCCSFFDRKQHQCVSLFPGRNCDPLVPMNLGDPNAALSPGDLYAPWMMAQDYSWWLKRRETGLSFGQYYFPPPDDAGAQLGQTGPGPDFVQLSDFFVGSYVRDAGFLRVALARSCHLSNIDCDRVVVMARVVVVDPHTQKFSADVAGHYDQVPFTR